MEQTKLETTLEVVLQALGGELGRRVFWDEIKVAAQVDDVLGTGYKPGDGLDKLTTGERADYSEAQELVANRLFFLFRRRGIIGNLAVEYILGSAEETSDQSEIVDALIARNRVPYETVEIGRQKEKILPKDLNEEGRGYQDKISPLVYMEVHEGRISNPMFFEDETSPYIRGIERIEQFHETKDVDGLCMAIVDFFREHKDV